MHAKPSMIATSCELLAPPKMRTNGSAVVPSSMKLSSAACSAARSTSGTAASADGGGLRKARSKSLTSPLNCSRTSDSNVCPCSMAYSYRSACAASKSAEPITSMNTSSRKRRKGRSACAVVRSAEPITSMNTSSRMHPKKHVSRAACSCRAFRAASAFLRLPPQPSAALAAPSGIDLRTRDTRRESMVRVGEAGHVR